MNWPWRRPLADFEVRARSLIRPATDETLEVAEHVAGAVASITDRASLLASTPLLRRRGRRPAACRRGSDFPGRGPPDGQSAGGSDSAPGRRPGQVSSETSAVQAAANA